jgi:surface polysaccharide O-acyltransferase-like enzyme
MTDKPRISIDIRQIRTLANMNHPETTSLDGRRHDLDWLRVLAFGLLILYHIGMLYVSRWGYHFKSQYSSTGLENLMLLVNPWRMTVLWIISGVASCYMLDKLRWSRFLINRSARLLLPLAFGVWVIVPPQLFVEMTGNGDFSSNYWEFYRQFLQPDGAAFAKYSSGIWPHVDVNHLWYLRELWQFTLLLVLFLPLLNWLRKNSVFARLTVPVGAFSVLAATPMLMIALDIAVIPEFGNEGRRIGLGLAFFVLGYGIAREGNVWQSFARVRHWALALALMTFAGYLVVYHQVWLDPNRDLSGTTGHILMVLDHSNRWFWLCAVFGYAHRHLNRPHPRLSYLSEGVFAYYIVHQTIILLLASWLAPFALGSIVEPTLVVIGTFAGCVASHEIARRIGILRPLMGLKWKSRTPAESDPRWAVLARTAAAMMIAIPIGMEILL